MYWPVNKKTIFNILTANSPEKWHKQSDSNQIWNQMTRNYHAVDYFYNVNIFYDEINDN